MGTDKSTRRAGSLGPTEFIRDNTMNPIEQQFFNDLEKKLWTAADKLRSNLDAAVYKHVVLGLIFLKYVSDAFEERQKELREQFQNPDHDYYMAPEDYPDDYEGTRKHCGNKW